MLSTCSVGEPKKAEEESDEEEEADEADSMATDSS